MLTALLINCTALPNRFELNEITLSSLISTANFNKKKYQLWYFPFIDKFTPYLIYTISNKKSINWDTFFLSTSLPPTLRDAIFTSKQILLQFHHVCLICKNLSTFLGFCFLKRQGERPLSISITRNHEAGYTTQQLR